jgi:hypothetical protein
MRSLSTWLSSAVLAMMVLGSLGAVVPAAVLAGSAAPNAYVTVPYFSTTATSTNWAGYAVTAASGTVTYVAGSWVQPSVKGTCPSGARYASFWVGIDGYSSSTVEQTGTDTDCAAGSPSYYAWYEFYPANSVVISSVPIHAGDTIFASVSYSSSTSKFTVLLKDVTTGTSYSKAGSVSGAARSSAEWITETPEICSSTCRLAHLTNFGTVDWGLDHTHQASTNVATISGSTRSIGNFSGSNVVAITMWNTAGTKVMASPSALSADRTSFAVTWKSVGP